MPRVEPRVGNRPARDGLAGVATGQRRKATDVGGKEPGHVCGALGAQQERLGHYASGGQIASIAVGSAQPVEIVGHCP